MKFRTEVKLSKLPFSLSYENSILNFGSCFAEHIAKKLENFSFPIFSNPFGILYNPISIANALRAVIENRKYTSSDLSFYDGQFISFDHHGSFSNQNEAIILQRINTEIKKVHNMLGTTNLLLINFGSAMVFCLKEQNKIVGNCHKIPQKKFAQEMLSILEIRETWDNLLTEIRTKYPNMNIVFTVSPVRYLYNSFHDNQISKSLLHLVIKEFIEKEEKIFYFPSYEIMMDDLRDYRFYKDDMIHPNEIAIDYIFEKFCSCLIGAKVGKIIQEIKSVQRDLNHQVRNKNSAIYQKFLKTTANKIMMLREKYPNVRIDGALFSNPKGNSF